MQGRRIRNLTSQVGDGANGDGEEEGIESSNILDRFKFFATYEERAKEKERKKKKVFRITPPREGAQVDEELLKAHMPKRCMAINCPVCRLRVICCGHRVFLYSEPRISRFPMPIVACRSVLFCVVFVKDSTYQWYMFPVSVTLDILKCLEVSQPAYHII